MQKRVFLLRLVSTHPKKFSTMAPKRQASAIPKTPDSKEKGKGKGKAEQEENSNSSNKKVKVDHQKQSSLTSFFKSPSSILSSPEKRGLKEEEEPNETSTSYPHRNGNGSHEIIDVDALEDDLEQAALKQIRTDEEFARNMQEEWDYTVSNTSISKPIPSSTFASASNNVSASTSNTFKSEGLAPMFRSQVEKKPIVQEKKDVKPFTSTSAFSSTSSPSKGKSPSKKTFDFNTLDHSVSSIPLAQDIFEFDPTIVDTSTWPTAASASEDGIEPLPTTPYALLTAAFVLISSTKSRLIITTVLTNLLRVIRHHDRSNLLPSIYLISNSLAPSYDGVELGLGGAIVNKVVKDVTGASSQKLKSLWVSRFIEKRKEQTRRLM